MKQVSFHPAALHKILVRQKFERIDLERDFATLRRGNDLVRVNLGTATLSSSPNWLVLRQITLTTPQGSFNLAGLSADAVASLDTALKNAHRRKSLLASLSEQADQTVAALLVWDKLAARDAYLTFSNVQNWRVSIPELTLPNEDDTDLFAHLAMDQQRHLRRIIALSKEPQKAAEVRNAEYARQQLTTFKPFFDEVETNPLTDQQRQAIVHDEDNALVIAGAGTGKTSTVVGKVGFILKKGWAAPDEILLLAFTVKAAEEMRERIGKKLDVDVKVRTFHGLGLEIIAQARGKKPSLCREAEDQKAKTQTLEALSKKLLANDEFRQDLLAFQPSLRRAYKPAWEFNTLSEYTQYLLDVEPRALTGRLLKSYEECEIANWLVAHGIPFEYERPYEIDTASTEYRQYKPDFYLPEHSIYVEHWGVDQNEKPAPFIDQAKYRDKMTWARNLHAENGTTLVETYSWEKQQGILLSRLEAKLREHGIRPSPISGEDALHLLNEQGQFSPFVKLVGTFLSLFKSAGITVKELEARLDRGGDRQRAARFLRLFGSLSTEYEALLQERGEIDFDDMITQAHECVQGGSYHSGFRYILVDEFQDIAAGRAKLVMALRNQVQKAKLFCVGDDWQSIYRFTGSDISLTTKFEDHFGFTRETPLDYTFRFHDKIAAFSSRFVQKNPGQIRKELFTQEASHQPGVVVWTQDGSCDPLESILAEIEAVGKASVFLLARYKFMLPENLKALQNRFRSLTLKNMTAHGSKGLEADYVVVLGMASGKYGFPSQIADDPVLGMVLADSEQFEAAEERRLFYVALTRARKRVYLVSDASKPSAFIREILADDGYEKEVAGGTSSHSDICPACQRGEIVKREGKYGIIYGCTNFPICTYIKTTCSRCKQGRMREAEGAEAKCDACDFAGRVCPRCQKGILGVKRNRSNGNSFWACSMFGRQSESCDYTEPYTGAAGGETPPAAGQVRRNGSR